MKLRMGRRRPDGTLRKLRLRHYVDHAALPPVPKRGGYVDCATAALSRMYLNDQLGCCVIAGGAHVRGVTSACGEQCREPVQFTDQQIVDQYRAIGGYDPRYPEDTDNGCDEQTAMRYWQRHGFPDGVRLTGWATVEPHEAALAIYLFGNVLFGCEMPDAWLEKAEQHGAGFAWGVDGAPNPRNGHCFTGHAWDEHGITVCSWGMLGTITHKAIERYAVPPRGELYTLFSPDIIDAATAKAPSGLDAAALLRDLRAIDD